MQSQSYPLKERTISAKSLFIVCMGCMVIVVTSRVEATFDVQFDSLPTAQGWFYQGHVAESIAFSVDGTTLTQNTLGQGDISAVYFMNNVIDPTLPFTLSVRARVLQSDGPGSLPFALWPSVVVRSSRQFLVQMYFAFKVRISSLISHNFMTLDSRLSPVWVPTSLWTMCYFPTSCLSPVQSLILFYLEMVPLFRIQTELLSLHGSRLPRKTYSQFLPLVLF